MENLKSRSEIENRYKWNLTYLVKDDKEFNLLINKCNELIKEITNMKGSILNNKDTLSNYLKVSEELDDKLNRLYIYAYNNHASDTADESYLSNLDKIERLAEEASLSESYVVSEFMKSDEKYTLNLLKEANIYDEYSYHIKELYKDKDRILSEEEEKIISLANNTFGSGESAFSALDNTDIKFDNVLVDGKEVELTPFNYSLFLENKDQSVRCDAFTKMYKFYKEHNNTITNLLKGRFQELNFNRKVRKYNSLLDMELHSINVSPKVYEMLISKVNQYMDLNVEFQKIKANLLGLKEYHLYDTYVPIINNDKKYSLDEAIDNVKNALSILGEDYMNHFNRLYEEGTIDFLPNKNKRSGAYEISSYRNTPYVLLNYDGTYNDVSTIAHECGHAVHSMYSDEDNTYVNHSYDIFLAEIASTTNEMLLSIYNINNAKTKEDKLYFLVDFLNLCKATIYRQTMFSEFEEELARRVENNEAVTPKILNDYYYDLNKKYFKDSVVIDEDIKYEWSHIPHFYSPFYVYKYATGLITAICFANRLLKDNNYKEIYINSFLKAGSRKDVLDILKDAGIDLTSEESFDEAFSFISERLNELKSIVKEMS